MTTTTFDTLPVPVPGQREIRITTVRDHEGTVLRVLIVSAWPDSPAWPLPSQCIELDPDALPALIEALQQASASLRKDRAA